MNKLIINTDVPGPTISRHIYGHFAEHLGRCIYEGLWVGEDSPIPNTRGFRNDVVGALKKLRIPNLRWPGGCFADTYHWADGIGPREQRPETVNVHWGGVAESNHCGTHEFLDLCEQLSTPDAVCEPYLAGNVGSGTVKEMADWLEYLTHPAGGALSTLRKKNGRAEPWPLKFWGVGNESWGCGGMMRPQYYADLFRQYATFCRNFAPGQTLYKVAAGLSNEFNEVLMKEAAGQMDGLSIHYYTVPGPWTKKGSATDFGEADWRITMQKAANIEDFIKQTAAMMDRYDPAKRVGIVMDEWGTWFDVEPGTNPGFLYQQNTIRDAVVAGISFNVFNNHADRVQVANVAQTVNVLQAMVLTDNDRMLLTPTYHVFEMFKVHQDATLLPSTVHAPEYAAAQDMVGTAGANGATKLSATPQISASASRDSAGVIHLSLCNLHHADAADVACHLRGMTVKSTTGRVLTSAAMNAMNTFDAPNAVTPTLFDGARVTDTGLHVTLPARSVVVLEVR